MAGTRLLLTLVYLIEIPLLIFLAVRHAILNSRSLKTKWHPAHLPVFAHRSGVSILEGENFNGSLSQITSILNQKVNADVFLRFVGKDGTRINEEYKDRAFMSLMDGLEVQKARMTHESSVIIRLHNVEHSNDIAIQNCNDVDVTSFSEHLNADMRYARGYNIFVSMDCEDSLVKVSENGSTFVRFKKGISEDDILILLKTEVSPLIHRLLYGATKKKRNKFPTRASKVLISLVDPNPSSHVTNIQNALEHHTRLNNSFMGMMDHTLVPMIDRLSQYVDITIATPESLPYFGHDLASHATENELEDGFIDYSFSIQKAKEILSDGDLSHIAHGSATPDIEEDFYVDTIRIILYLADGELTPMFAEKDDTWSRAFSLPSNNIALALINIPSEVKFSYDDEITDKSSDIRLDEYYEYEMKRALSYIGSFLRTHFGLASQQPHYEEVEESNVLPVHHEPAKFGVAQWELDCLLRETLHMKANEVLESLKQMNELIRVRSRLSITTKVRL
jgi:hypothetical protein